MRTIRLRNDDRIYEFFIRGEHCLCGANVMHYEYDGEKMYGVCNACQDDVFIVKPEYAKELLGEGIWKVKE